MNSTISAKTIRSVIAASSVGTMIEWYDFYIFGMLAKTISTQFFPEGNTTAALLSTLAIFAAGFIVRPFGALVFGRLGDLIGRKYVGKISYIDDLNKKIASELGADSVFYNSPEILAKGIGVHESQLWFPEWIRFLDYK